ncbi:hypothetical protein AAG906_000775 [Vitis piasezkii]
MKGGGRSLVCVDSKSLKSRRGVWERCKVIIVERSRGFTVGKVWKFHLCCFGRGGGFLIKEILPSVSEGKGIMGGWVLLAEKLRFLGVMSRDEPRGNATFYGTGSTVGESEGKAQKSYVDVVKSREKKVGETLWLQLGEKDISSERKLMDRCLVGSWGHTPLSDLDMYALESWGRTRWNIKGGLKFARIGGPLLLIEFENKDEAYKVLLRGNRWFKESTLHLDRWDPKVGCSQNGERAESVWVRVVGLPLHFGVEAFRKIGDCGGSSRWMKTPPSARS